MIPMVEFHIFDEGVITRISGKMGSGKTHGALFLAERSFWKLYAMQSKQSKHRFRYPYKILTNIKINWKEWENKHNGKPHPMKEYFIFITSLRGLFNSIVEVDKGILILDEAGIFASSGYSSKSKSIGQWEHILKLCRKFGLAIMWIDQRGKGSTPPTVRDLSTYHIDKPGKYNMIMYEVFYTDNGRDPREKVVGKYRYRGGVTIPFYTKAPSSFDMRIGEKEVFVKGKWVTEELQAEDVFNATKDCTPENMRPVMKKFLIKHGIHPESPSYASDIERDNNTVDSTPGTDTAGPATTKGLVYQILDKAHAKGTTLKPRELRVTLSWIRRDTLSKYISSWKKDRGIENP